ncbi:hypothetical protein [Streptomyces cyaneofuscatus]|uniref:Uncharacterized protein n=1 Tax=Streptomyces cyaneofuscatus TaxID=66883 RepID=A0ABZ1EVR3_9ACTN|nr:hypothetical protein [Streptomyces cyaneofuscatus]WSB08213.1 hypothetical protein OG849_13605 [Streptomyces cyaneofuscatus]WSD48254.1 hypothetical protein OG857_21800 [Streptomyces cyaneofuscatus]
MTRSQRIAAWVLATLFGLISLGLGIYLAKIGLEKANQLSGILGLFIALAGLAIAIWSALNARTAIQSPRQGRSGGVHQSQRSGDNSKNIQAGGDINFGDSNRF